MALLLLLGGCLPHSCQRSESRELFPSDSLSREIAAETPVDTLVHQWRSTGSPDQSLAYPRTLRWSAGGERLFVSDAGNGRLQVLDGSRGNWVGTIELPNVAHPYIMGWRADSLVILDPDRHRIHLVTGGEVVRSYAVKNEALDRSYLYGVETPDGVAIKAVRKDRGARILFLSEHGAVRRSVALPGPHWLHAGFLRAWGDSILSLSGYRPVAHVVESDGTTDTLQLSGFDSPMLSRSLLFARGEVGEPPLLSASAAPSGPFLFVLNMRPGWLQVDVFDHAGILQRVLTEDRDFDSNYYPVDLAVDRRHDGAYAIAVAVARPVPRVELYTWRPPAE